MKKEAQLNELSKKLNAQLNSKLFNWNIDYDKELKAVLDICATLKHKRIDTGEKLVDMITQGHEKSFQMMSSINKKMVDLNFEDSFFCSHAFKISAKLFRLMMPEFDALKALEKKLIKQENLDKKLIANYQKQVIILLNIAVDKLEQSHSELQAYLKKHPSSQVSST